MCAVELLIMPSLYTIVRRRHNGPSFICIGAVCELCHSSDEHI